MKFLVVLLPIIALILACGGNADGPANYTAEAGAKVFKLYCSSCHGIDGTMQMNGAKDLRLSILTYAQRVELVKNGKGAMTPFGNILSEEEIAMSAKYSMSFTKSE